MHGLHRTEASTRLGFRRTGDICDTTVQYRLCLYVMDMIAIAKVVLDLYRHSTHDHRKC